MKPLNKWFDLINRKINPRYQNIVVDFTDEELKMVKQAAKAKGMNIHQYIEHALEHQRRMTVLDELVADAQESGLYD